MHLYGPPVAINTRSHIPLQLFPCINFTCQGGIVRLIFVAEDYSESGNVQLPLFALWRAVTGEKFNYWEEVQKLSQYQQLPLIHRNISAAVYEIVFQPRYNFNRGYILGVYHDWHDTDHNSTYRTTYIQSTVTMLHQNGGGRCDGLAYYNAYPTWQPARGISQPGVFPYIAIETG